jgi:hypothetical protein
LTLFGKVEFNNLPSKEMNDRDQFVRLSKLQESGDNEE